MTSYTSNLSLLLLDDQYCATSTIVISELVIIPRFSQETKRPSKEMQVTIARQLGLDPSTVSNFFMNARRRSIDKWREDPRPDSADDANEDPEDDVYEEDDDDLRSTYSRSPSASGSPLPLYNHTSSTSLPSIITRGALKATTSNPGLLMAASPTPSTDEGVVAEILHPSTLVSHEALSHHQDSLEL